MDIARDVRDARTPIRASVMSRVSAIPLVIMLLGCSGAATWARDPGCGAGQH